MSSAPRDLKINCVKIVVQNPTKSGNGTKGFLTGTMIVVERTVNFPY